MEISAKPFVTPAQPGAHRLKMPEMDHRLREGDGVFGRSVATSSPAGQPGTAERQSAEIARQFETLIAETLLRSARAARLGDDGLGAGDDQVRSLVDHQRAEAIARAAPLGVARLLQAAPK